MPTRNSTRTRTDFPLRIDAPVRGPHAAVRDGSVEATVAALGADGDGVLRIEGATWFAPCVLPGERVRVHPGLRQSAVLEAILEASADRVAPPCGLFGRCGGCTLQHMAPAAMAGFKQGLVCEALGQAGFALPDTIGFSGAAPGSRRRMDLALRRTVDGLLIGLHRRHGREATGPGAGSRADEVVDLTECHVLEPRLFALIAAMRPVLLRLGCLRGNGSMIANLLDSGPDLLLATDVPPDSADRSRLAGFAREARIPRIAWRPLRGGSLDTETVCSTGPVHHELSGVRVSPPPGAFLQASRSSETAIVAAVLAGLPGALTRGARVIELFAGCGTLSFALAGRAKLLAVEGQKEAVACLRAAASGMRLEALHRDLVRQPLLAGELGRAVAIVLDPPFAGAGPQMAEIARSGVARVIMASCNPRALRQDAGLLHAAGYGLERLTVIDQFLWSSGVESVAVFVKPRR